MEFLKQASSEKLKDVLQDTLLVLCQNSVLYKSQMTVEAIIAVTVDTSEILLVNIKDIMYKTQNPVQLKNIGSVDSDIKNEVDFEDGSTNAVDIPGDDSDIANIIQIEDDEEMFGAEHPCSYSYEAEELGLEHRSDFETNLPVMKKKSVSNKKFYQNAQNPASNYQDYNFEPDSISEIQIKSESALKKEPFDLIPPSQHLSAKNEQQTFYCKLCQKSFSNRSVYLYHKKQNHGQNDLSRNDLQTVEYNEEFDYLDNQESGITWPKSRIRKRVRANKACDEERQSFYTCNICGSMIRHLGTFKRHKNRHKGLVFRCDICEKSFTRRDYLIKHQQMCSMRNFGMQDTFQDYQASVEPGFDDLNC